LSAHHCGASDTAFVQSVAGDDRCALAGSSSGR
jgi:hypothetical protein